MANGFFCCNQDCDALTNGNLDACWKCGSALVKTANEWEEQDFSRPTEGEQAANELATAITGDAERFARGEVSPAEVSPDDLVKMRYGRRKLAMTLLENWRVAENMARTAKDQWSNVYLSSGPGVLADEMKAIYTEARAKADEKRNEILEEMSC